MSRVKTFTFFPYKSKKRVDACYYSPGMEDGFVTRYVKKEKDGSESYFLFPFDDKSETKSVPYITINGAHLIWGSDRVLVEEEGGKQYLMLKEEFEEKYEREG